MPRRCSRIASRGLGKQEQPRTQIRVEIPTHAPGLSEQLLASPGRLCHVSTPTLKRVRALECAGVCPRWAQIWAQTQTGENSEAGKVLKGMVGRDGIEPPTPGFSVLNLDRWHRSPSQLVAISKTHGRGSTMLRLIAPCCATWVTISVTDA